MAYEYITDNNLYNKQNYMYSKYYGMDFLKDYMASRKINNYTCGPHNVKYSPQTKSETYDSINRIHKELQNNTDRERTIGELNGYVKSFEVRKRLYDGYNGWKPIDGASFENYDSYLEFADCLLLAYSLTGNFKYYSCLLKVDDTLLSLQCNLTYEQSEHLQKIIDKELLFFEQILEQHGICMEA